MDKVQVSVQSMFTVKSSEDKFMILLTDTGDTRKFGIETGKQEVALITAYLFGQRPPTPSLYEVLSSYINRKNCKISEVCIDEMNDGIYKAKLSICGKEGSETECLNVKATDGIVLAILNNAPIYATQEVIYKGQEFFCDYLKGNASLVGVRLAAIDTDEVKLKIKSNELKQAIQNEDYELANQLQKEIENIKKDLKK